MFEKPRSGMIYEFKSDIVDDETISDWNCFEYDTLFRYYVPIYLVFIYLNTWSSYLVLIPIYLVLILLLYFIIQFIYGTIIVPWFV